MNSLLLSAVSGDSIFSEDIATACLLSSKSRH